MSKFYYDEKNDIEICKSLSTTISDLLNSIYSKENKNKEKDFNKLVKLMNLENVRYIIESIFLIFPKNMKKEKIELLKLVLQACNAIYNYSGENTGLTDTEYSALLDYYINITGEELPITEPISVNGNIISHKYTTLRGTLDKIYKITEEDVLKNESQKSLDDWVKSTEKRYYDATGKTIDLWEADVMVMPKFDGVSCVFECDKEGNLLRALTRGDTSRNEAQDVTHIFKDIYKGPFKDSELEYAEKTEVMMLNSDLDEYNEKYNKDYKNTRSIVSSIMNSKEADERINYLMIIPLRYSYYKDGEELSQQLSPGIYNYPYIKCKLKEVEKIHEFAFSHKFVEPGLRCDGAVIYIINEEIQNALGRKDEKQKFEVAFKYTEEVAYSELKDIKFKVGLFGRLTPVAVFKPVKMKGNKIENASLGSLKRFKKLRLAKGDIIKILYDIIPYVDYDKNDSKCVKYVHGEEIQVPNVCPDCGEPVTANENGNILYCKNPKCPCRIKGRILNFIQKMNIANISFETVDLFYEKGFLRCIDDLYKLEDYREELINLDGFGETRVDNILDEINNSSDVIPSVLLGSMGIEGISKKKFKKILEYLSFNDIIEYSLDERDVADSIAIFSAIPGIKEKTAWKLIRGIRENIDSIFFLMDNLNILEEPKEEEIDFKVVFTKIRDEGLEKLIKASGGSCEENVTKDTTFVVVPNLSVTSGNTKKANKYNIPLVPIGEVENYIKENILN